ncbi:MAG TPA: hypothetical protein VK604_05665 [Bryobacteraceae bacterium]|nr:hypothetical protein [Bryobacteraceae bacterium]
MYLFHVFRSFLPLRNPIGFGAADFVSFAVTALLVLCVLLWPLLKPYVSKIETRTRWSMLLLALLPIMLRLILLPRYPTPEPSTSKDFSYLLQAGAILHARFANPPHPFHRFFETAFVLQQPTYSSVLPPGQGIALAAGQALFGHSWAAVLLSAAAFSAACFWMLRGWTKPGWALLGGLLAVFQFGPLSSWMNSYAGGAISAIAGCLVFGALPRLQAEWRQRDAVLLGAGIALQLLARPFECALLVVSAALFFAPSLRQRDLRRKLLKTLPLVAIVVLPGILFLLLYNQQVTGNWTMSQYETGLVDRLRVLRFFLYAPLYVGLALFLWSVREWRFAWVLATLLLFLAGANFHPDSIACVACLFLLAAVTGLEKCSRCTVQVVVSLCVAQFLFWYSLHLIAPGEVIAGMTRYQTRDVIHHGHPEDRASVQSQLAQTGGKQLVFVRNRRGRSVSDWIHNDADIDRSRIIWARDLGPEEDEKLRNYYPDRTPWLLQTDRRPLKLEPYRNLP